MMDREYVKGQRLYVETNDSNLEGLFYCMDHDVMTLTDVILHPSGEKIGFTRLNKNEVIYVFIVDDPCEEGTESDAVRGNLVPQHEQAVHSQSCDALNTLVENHVLINDMGTEFRQAVEDIKAEPAVGFSMEGAMFGRYSQASLVSFATPRCAFLFDIYTLGDAAFDNGLRDILESEEIVKVIHNCRIVSDYLHHKHQVTICGVYDTQVGDLMVTQLRCGQIPRCVRSLPQCLNTYLNVPAHFIYCPEISEENIMFEGLQWNKRPLPIELEIGAVKNVIFLLQLQEKICEEVSRLLYRNVGVFLGVVRDSIHTVASQ